MREKIVEQIKSKRCIIDCHTHVGMDYKNYLSCEFPYCMSFEDLVVRMKHLGIDYAVLMPFFSSFYKLKPANPQKVETCEDFSKFPYELENRNLFKEVYEIFPEYADRAIPFVMFDPSRKAREQAELFEELYDSYPMFGLKTCTTHIQSFVRDLDTIGRPILNFARKHDLPITFHSSYDKADPWASVFDIVDFAEKHQEVKVCIAHSARFTQNVLEKAATLNNCVVDLAAFDIHCLLVRMRQRAVPPLEERYEAIIFTLTLPYPWNHHLR